jgi:RNA polymerase primary sigma factor
MSTVNSVFKMAVVAGVESAAQIHIDRGDDVNARDSKGSTLLMLAASRNRAAICRMLLDAGCDPFAVDHRGQTARSLALAAGAMDAAEILGSFESSLAASADDVTRGSSSDDMASSSFEASVRGSGHAFSPTQLPSSGESSGTGDNAELVDWEPEEESIPPLADPSVVFAAAGVQASISAHEPLNTDVSWDDADAFLPDMASRKWNQVDVEFQAGLRSVLLRALREGSVPELNLHSLAEDDPESANWDCLRIVGMAVNDLGGEIDERFEYFCQHEDFTVHVEEAETEAEQEHLDSILEFIDQVRGNDADPFRRYLRDIQRVRLISADEEVRLSKQMEYFRELADTALSKWENGIDLVVVAGNLVRSKERSLTSVSGATSEDHPDCEEQDESGFESDAMSLDSEEEEIVGFPPEDTSNSFLSTILSIAKLREHPFAEGHDTELTRLLGSLKLSTAFLFELFGAAEKDGSASALKFVEAMNGFLQFREQLVSANFKLVLYIAKKYLYSGKLLDDLVQEGNIGLLKAAERFDWRRGYKFSTYATWWIRQQIARSVADSARTIRIPVYLYEELQRLHKASRNFEAKNNRSPSRDELAAQLEISTSKVANLLAVPPEPESIDFYFDDELIDSSVYGNCIALDPFDVMAEHDLRRTIESALSTLKPKEEKVIRLRNGIGIGSAHTLEEVGEIYEITRERVRQIEANALDKLRHPGRSEDIWNAFFDSLPYRRPRTKSSSKVDSRAQDGALDQARS